jgi:alanine racemase
VTAGAVPALRWAEVELGALQHNAERVRSLLAPETRLMAMVKSNGYGHGLLYAAEGAVRGGATHLGVYHAAEALQLRSAGYTLPVLVVGLTAPQALPALVERDVDVTVVDAAGLEDAAAAATAVRRRARVHLKIDTGLNRIGLHPDSVGELTASLRRLRGRVAVAGVFTHFADADAADLGFTHHQHRRFLEAVETLGDLREGALLHSAGSAAILRLPETHHDLVRLGIALYGYVPPNTPTPGLRVAMSAFARVVQVKTLAAGDTVGYGRTWTAEGRARIATIAWGYAQGLRRDLSNRGCVVVRGRRCRIAGTVSMDQVGVDVTEVPGVEPGDEAMLFGERDGVCVGADEVAATAGTIPHEIVCAVPATVPRVAR